MLLQSCWACFTGLCSSWFLRRRGQSRASSSRWSSVVVVPDLLCAHCWCQACRRHIRCMCAMNCQSWATVSKDFQASERTWMGSSPLSIFLVGHVVGRLPMSFRWTSCTAFAQQCRCPCNESRLGRTTPSQMVPSIYEIAPWSREPLRAMEAGYPGGTDPWFHLQAGGEVVCKGPQLGNPGWDQKMEACSTFLADAIWSDSRGRRLVLATWVQHAISVFGIGCDDSNYAFVICLWSMSIICKILVSYP